MDNQAITHENREVIGIEELYPENGFNLFLTYCKLHSIKTTEDLARLNFDKIRFHGIGVGKLAKIKARYDNFLSHGLEAIQMQIESEKPLGNEIELIFDPQQEKVKPHLIKTVFPERKFEMFRTYCENNRIETLDQLIGFDLNKLFNLNGFGPGKLKKMLERLESFQEFEPNSRYDISDCNRTYSFHPDFLEVPAQLFFDSQPYRSVELKNVGVLGDLMTQDLQDLKAIRGFGKAKIDKLNRELDEFQKPIDEYIKITFEEIKTLDDYRVFWLRNFEKRTLESIGNMAEFNVTKERIRQKEDKFLRKASGRFRIIEDVLYRKHNLTGTAIIQPEQLMDWMGTSENAMIFRIFIKKGKSIRFKYSKPLNLIFVNIEPEEVEKELRIFFERKRDIFDLAEEIESITENLQYGAIGFLEYGSLEAFLISEGYYRSKGYFSRTPLTYSSMSEFLVRKYFPNGISRGEDMLRLNSLMQEQFDVWAYGPEDERSLWATFADRGNAIIQWGAASRIHIDNVVLSSSLINLIQEQIDQHLKRSDFLSTNNLYDELYEKIQSDSNIRSYHGLYGVIKYYLSDLYDLHHYSIRRSDRSISSIQGALEQFVIEQGGRVTLAEVKNKFRCTDVMISTAISINPSILLWNSGNSVIHASTLSVTDEQKMILSDTLHNSFTEEGYANVMMIQAVEPAVFRSIGADDIVSAFSVLQHLFSEQYYFYRRPTILRDRNVNYKRMEDLINLEMRKETVTDLELLRERVLRKYRWDETGFSATVGRMKSGLFQLDKSLYCLMDTCKIDEEIITVLEEVVRSCLSKELYVSCDDIAEQYLSEYHVSVQGKGFPVNYLVVKELIQKFLGNEFRIISRTNVNYRFDKAVIVDASTPLEGLGDLISHILTMDGNGRKWTVSNAELHLRNKRIIAGRMPDEFLSMRNVIIHENGTLEISEKTEEGGEEDED